MVLDLSRFLREAKRRDAPLAYTALGHLALAAVFLVLMAFDERTITGVNAWLKPFKFALSIAIYAVTVAWLLEYMGERRWLRRLASWTIVASMWIEIVCIAGQAARGTTSHFNTANALDAAIFSTMGTLIAINTVVAVGLLVWFSFAKPDLPPPYLWGIRLGLAVFLIGSAVGGQLVANNGHTVGAPDGGPGLPVVNWSTEAGDLRIAHGAGLHALQILPFLGFLLTRAQSRLSRSSQLWIVIVSSVLYAAAVGALYLQAMNGRPLIPL